MGQKRATIRDSDLFASRGWKLVVVFMSMLFVAWEPRTHEMYYLRQLYDFPITDMTVEFGAPSVFTFASTALVSLSLRRSIHLL